MKFNKFFLGLCAVLALMVTLATFAQPYYTNSTPANGGYQPNDNLTAPLVPSATISRQIMGGILAGTQTVTNTASVIPFGTNIFTVAPVVVASTSSVTNVAAITSVTTSNVTIATSYNANTLYWHVIGH